MFNRFKSFASFILVFGLLGLMGCDQKTPREEFIDQLKADREAGFSFMKIADKINSKHYVNIPDLGDEILEEYDFEEMDKEHEEYEVWMLQFVENIKERNCEGVEDNLKQRDPVTWYSEKTLIGIFAEEGICGEKDPYKAALNYQEIIDEGVKSSVVAARLGNLYWKGEGVRKDYSRANDLFTQAVLWESSVFFSEEQDDLFFDAFDTTDYEIWGLTVRQMAKAFAAIETGPWKLPEPLLEKISWLQSLGVNEGRGLVETAKNIFRGENNYDQDIETAIILMANASNYFNNDEAMYLASLWGMDQEVCTLRLELNSYLDCEWEYNYSFSNMEMAAFDGNKNAINYLIEYFTLHSDEIWADWSLYQYFLLAQKHEMEIDFEYFSNLKNNLGTFETGLIETWIEEDYNWPITNDLPH